MERFAFKIDKVLKANLCKICRLCGIDNPDKVPILRENEEDVFDVDAEPELSQKIHDCIGLLISKDDKMPQMICSLCVDKINDFYEFREMCYATNIQTRKLLGLKDAPKKNLEIKVEVKTETASTEKGEKRGRKRKSDDINFETEIKIENEKPRSVLNANLSKKKVRLNYAKQKNQIADSESLRMEFKNELKLENITDIDNSKLKQICKICKQRFGSKYKLDRHKFLEHTPNIPRFVCTTCDETLKMNGEIKNHQLWHKLSKTPYTCALCLDTMSSINLYTRHLRDHAQKFATPLVVLDRECALCHETFCTNFLYNIHPCAVRTQKCGGCNRQVKSDVEYLRHASTCEKAYLMISKHLTAALESVQIKNENEVEAAAESLIMGTSVPIPDMLETSDDLNADPKISADTLLNKSTKKSGKKGISKKDLKRVDDLLKSTMDALVSIKHEPEMNVDLDIPNNAEHHVKNNASQDDDDFQNRDDDSDEEDAGPFIPIVQLQAGSEVVIKQEPLDSPQTEMANTLRTVNVSVKKELPDSGYEDSSATGSVAKVPVLKLKITKEHGMLNSSLVDESSTCREKKKKKKKRRDIDRTNEQDDNEILEDGRLDTSIVSSKKSSEFFTMPQPGVIHIKQERLDDDYIEDNMRHETHDPALNYSTIQSVHPEATVMTSIPMMQLQISCVSSGVNFDETNAEREAVQDIKPNRAELDRWLENTNRTLTALPILEDESEGISNSSTSRLQQYHSQHIKKTQCRSKAFKSTGGMSHQNNTNIETPKIVAVTSGFDPIEANNKEKEDSNGFVLSNMSIKAEPFDVGYENVLPIDGHMNPDKEMENSLTFQDHQNNSKDNSGNDDKAYINSIDFNDIRIKQEKDIDVSESQLTAQQFSTYFYNGEENISMEPMSENNECKNVGYVKSIHKAIYDAEVREEFDDDEEGMEIEEEENAQREYRELEWPPPQTDSKSEISEKCHTASRLMITNVCSQAAKQLEKNAESDIVTEKQIAKSQKNNKSSENNASKLKTTYSHRETPLTLNNDNVKSSISSSSASVKSCSSGSEKVSKDSVRSVEVDSITKTTSNELGDTKESAVKIVSFKVVENVNCLLETTPHLNSIENENIESAGFTQPIDEEQQNILNQEVLANNETQPNNGTVLGETLDQETSARFNFSDCNRNCTQPSSSFVQSLEEKPTTSTMLTVCNEETENFFNESVDAADRRQQQDQEAMHCVSSSFNLSQQRVLLIDDSNINEIAENNNNANIERELLDENSNNERISELSSVNQETSVDDVT